MARGEAEAYAILRGAGDQLARRATLLLDHLTGPSDPATALDAAADLDAAVRYWQDATDGLTAVESRPDRAAAQLFSGLLVHMGTADTALSGLGPGRLDGRSMVIVTILAGASTHPATDPDLDQLHFAAPWPNARDCLDAAADQIRGLPR